MELRLTHVSVAWLTPLTHHSHPEPLKADAQDLAFSRSESCLCGIPGNKAGRRERKKKKPAARFIKSPCSDTPYLSLDTIHSDVLMLVIIENKNSQPSSCSSNSTGNVERSFQFYDLVTWLEIKMRWLKPASLFSDVSTSQEDFYSPCFIFIFKYILGNINTDMAPLLQTFVYKYIYKYMSHLSRRMLDDS